MIAFLHAEDIMVQRAHLLLIMLLAAEHPLQASSVLSAIMKFVLPGNSQQQIVQEVVEDDSQWDHQCGMPSYTDQCKKFYKTYGIQLCSADYDYNGHFGIFCYLNYGLSHPPYLDELADDLSSYANPTPPELAKMIVATKHNPLILRYAQSMYDQLGNPAWEALLFWASRKFETDVCKFLWEIRRQLNDGAHPIHYETVICIARIAFSSSLKMKKPEHAAWAFEILRELDALHTFNETGTLTMHKETFDCSEPIIDIATTSGDKEAVVHLLQSGIDHTGYGTYPLQMQNCSLRFSHLNCTDPVIRKMMALFFFYKSRILDQIKKTQGLLFSQPGKQQAEQNQKQQCPAEPRVVFLEEDFDESFLALPAPSEEEIQDWVSHLKEQVTRAQEQSRSHLLARWGLAHCPALASEFITDDGGNNPLHCAVFAGNPLLIKLCLWANADLLQLKNRANLTPLELAYGRNLHVSLRAIIDFCFAVAASSNHSINPIRII